MVESVKIEMEFKKSILHLNPFKNWNKSISSIMNRVHNNVANVLVFKNS